MMKDKRVFVSGGAGVIGTALVLQLYKLGAKVFVGDLKPRPENWPAEVIYRQGDLNYIAKAEIDDFGPDYFFHLAATFERSIETYDFWEENYHHNIALSHHLMNCLKDSKSLKKVIFASSYLIYDPEEYCFLEPPEKVVALAEEDIIKPRNLCGAAKLYHEAELEFLSQFNLGFDFVAARIFRSYGKNSRDFISRSIRAVLKDETIDVYAEEGMFDYIYADEVAQGLIQLANSAATGIVNLGSGKARKVRELIDCLSENFPDMNINHITKTIPFEASQADITRLTELTKWSPTKLIEDTIPEIILYERKQTNSKKEQPCLNIMVTSISKKVPLIKALRKANLKLGNQGKIIGADASNNIIGKYFVDDFWLMPQFNKIKVEEFISYCLNQKISCIIPSRDGELAFFAENKDVFEQNGIKIMISGFESVNTCLDKLLFYQRANALGFPAIRTVEDINLLPDGALVVKERFGAGSRKIGLNIKRETAIIHGTNLENPIFQPYVVGKEASIDVYVNKQGKTKGVVTRTRDLVVDGESQVTTTFRDKDLEQLCVSLAEKLNIYGHAVFQVIINEHNEFHIIECNNRFGGASTLSLAAGLDSFYWFLLECLGEDIDKYPFIRTSGDKKQIRFAENLII
jgi:carbamoyl-phosphate synthase large subunit